MENSLFTAEQMTGSGQLSMTDLISANQKRIEELKTLPHTFWEDPGHAWLEVQYQDLIILNLLGAISGYSYRNGTKVYLEEDMDAGRFIDALFGPYGERTPEQEQQWQNWKALLKSEYRENIFIRRLKYFK